MKIKLFLVFLAFIFAACAPANKQNEDKKTAASFDIFAVVMLYPNIPQSSGLTVYAGFAQLSYIPPGSGSNSDFDKAVIKVNTGSPFANSPPSINYSYFNLTDFVQLQDGNTINISLQHSLTGNLSGNLTVPPSLTDFTVTPSLPIQGSANSNSAYALSWTPVGADCYQVELDCYDSSNTFKTSFTYYTAGNSYTFTSELKDSNNQFYPYIRFYVSSVNWLKFSNETPIPYKYFSVQSQYYNKTHTNRP
jgi:hypothetical protein